jgi:hypothetical protein
MFANGQVHSIAQTGAKLHFVSSKLDGLAYGCAPMPSESLHGLIIPEVLKSVRRHRGIAYGMLNVLVPQIVEESPDVLYAFYHVSCVS